MLLGWMMGPASVGTYAVAYDLSFQGLTALMMLVNLSAFPLAVRALEEQGVDAASRQLTEHATLLFGLAAPGTVGLAVLGPNVARVLLGHSFQQSTAQLVPWLVVAAFVAGMKGFYFDLSFQLARATVNQIVVTGSAALFNVALNLSWIPRFGALGAAWAALVTYLLAGSLSILLGRRVFRMPIPLIDWTKIVAASGVMAVAVRPFAFHEGKVALALQVMGGVTVYAIAVLVLNVGRARTVLTRRLRPVG